MASPLDVARTATLAVTVLAATPKVHSAEVLAVLDPLAPDTVVGDWEYSERVDAMTDRVVRVAQTTNSAGFELRIFRVESGAVHGLFVVPETSTDVLNVERYPMYRIDRHPPFDLDGNRSVARYFDEPLVLQEPKWVQFLIWHGEGPYPAGGSLYDLMHGNQILFRYFLFTGGYKETSFSLDGARDTIVRALELTPPPGDASR